MKHSHRLFTVAIVMLAPLASAQNAPYSPYHSGVTIAPRQTVLLPAQTNPSFYPAQLRAPQVQPMQAIPYGAVAVLPDTPPIAPGNATGATTGAAAIPSAPVGHVAPTAPAAPTTPGAVPPSSYSIETKSQPGDYKPKDDKGKDQQDAHAQVGSAEDTVSYEASEAPVPGKYHSRLPRDADSLRREFYRR